MSRFKPLLVGLLALVALLVWISGRNQSRNRERDVTEISQASPAKVNPDKIADTIPSHECPKTSVARARKVMAETLQNIYKREGRMLTVTAAGADCEILELSGMLAEGNYTFDAAQRETIGCGDCMLLYKKLRFKAVHFIGPGMNAEYQVQ